MANNKVIFINTMYYNKKIIRFQILLYMMIKVTVMD